LRKSSTSISFFAGFDMRNLTIADATKEGETMREPGYAVSRR
jgi:hypothetical protein